MKGPVALSCCEEGVREAHVQLWEELRGKDPCALCMPNTKKEQGMKWGIQGMEAKAPLNMLI